jgi:hypothetical protein
MTIAFDDCFISTLASNGDRAGQAPPLRIAGKRRFVGALEDLVRCACGSFDAEGHLVGYADAVAFQGYYFFRVIG